MQEKPRIPRKYMVTKALRAKGSVSTVIPKPFLDALGIGNDSYLEHTLTEDGAMITRVLKLRDEQSEVI